jgi:pyridoxamine 5'-phosphate oxidase
MAIRKQVADMRTDYSLHRLDETQAHADPIRQFELWFQAAAESEVPEPNAMTLATVTDGQPAARIVLLKGFDEKGFVFFTNYESRKGAELATNPRAALVFFWSQLERQVRIEGTTVKIDPAESDAYFQSRDKGSRIGAWASPQSQVIQDRNELETRVKSLLEKYEEEEFVPRPDHWGGYRLEPARIEFWQGRKSRLHDRLLYLKAADGSWTTDRLAP